MGFIGYIILIIVIIAGLKENGFFDRHRRYNEDVEKKEKRPSIFIEFVKAKYKKYCPKIEWD